MLKSTFVLFSLFLFVSNCMIAQKPNVVLIITDDQGYGDLGFHGNHHVKTPVLDQLAKESIRFNNFYVSPVCAPTRSSLMTGRYSLRTGVRDTYNGGAIMHTNEITIAEMLRDANYSTGMFGKWHLGDNFPSRPNDQGFDESVIHLSGGMGQVGDFTTYFQGDRSYFDPVLWHNGEQQSYQGYCSDIFTDQALNFIENNQDQPFFCYLSFNAPHTPLQVPEKYYQMYKDVDPSDGFEDGRPFPDMTEKDMEDARRIYAMVSNIDDNVGRVLAKLNELKLSENTIVIFLTDNGPQQRRYVAGMRGRKSDVYRGGVRVPMFLRYPALKSSVDEVDLNAAHIDMLPTLADFAGAKVPDDRIIDGRNLVPMLTKTTGDWQERSLFFNWTRKYPEKYRNLALLKGNLKLVGNTNYNANLEAFELYDLQQDPYEQENIIQANLETAEELKSELDQLIEELVNSKNITEPPLIGIGHKEENPVVLNRNDAKGQRGIWAQEKLYGYWDVAVEEGHYDIRFRFIKPLQTPGRLILETGTTVQQLDIDATGEEFIEMKDVYLPAYEGALRPLYASKDGNIFPFWVELNKRN